MSIAHWIGARAADVVAFFRDKPIVPCQIDWDNQLPDSFFDTLEERVDIDEFFANQARSGRNFYGDDCDSCDEGCCLTTDTIGEFREWNQRG